MVWRSVYDLNRFSLLCITPTCERQTDGQTDKWTYYDSVNRASIASCGKMNGYLPQDAVLARCMPGTYLRPSVCPPACLSVNRKLFLTEKQNLLYLGKRHKINTVSTKDKQEVVGALSNDVTVDNLDWPGSLQVTPTLHVWSAFISLKRLKLVVKFCKRVDHPHPTPKNNIFRRAWLDGWQPIESSEFVCVAGTKGMSPYRRERSEAARVSPANKYADYAYPEDVGVSDEFRCNIW